MRVLILYHQSFAIQRNTSKESLECFYKYSGAFCEFINIEFGIPSEFSKSQYDVLIFHYSLLALRWAGRDDFLLLVEKLIPLKGLAPRRVIIPQDEYFQTELLHAFCTSLEITEIYTCFSTVDWSVAYPREAIGQAEIFQVFTGYVDDQWLLEFRNDSLTPHSARPLDVGYRARSLPAWLGAHGQLKTNVAQFLNGPCQDAGLKVDISIHFADTLAGKEWPRFLSNTRTVLGCEGGASVLDSKGVIKQKVEDYVLKNPKASFQEIRSQVLGDEDGRIHLFCLSPRHFEAAMLKTTQVLVEGDYNGVLRAEIDYISIKSDFSNISDVIEKIKDHDLCQRIAESAYNRISTQESYRYSYFVHKVLKLQKPAMPRLQSSPLGPSWSQVKVSPLTILKFYLLRGLYSVALESQVLPIYRRWKSRF